MTITPEQLAAFADGELDGETASRAAAAVAADPALAAQLAAHRALRAQLSAHFAPILAEPLPDRLVPGRQGEPADGARDRPTDGATVINFAQRARERTGHADQAAVRRWRVQGWPVGGAIAAALVLGIMLGTGTGLPWRTGGDDADLPPQLVAALDAQASGPASGRNVTIMLSFVDRTGRYCRAYSTAADGGIACRNTHGWQPVWGGGSVTGSADGSMRQAGSDAAALMATAQNMADDGGALDTAQERAAMARDWQR
ncbi:MAG: anti-sigma factor [Sphingopyxis sp.]